MLLFASATMLPNQSRCVVLEPKVRDLLFAREMSQRVLQLHLLDEQVVLRIQTRCYHRALEIEREPLLDAAHTRALRQVEEDREIEHDRCGQDRVSAEEIDLDL